LNRRNLNLNGLKAFEAAARHLSFKRAAEELMVTHTAISYHVRQLEQSFGVRLFERGVHGIELTEAGAKLYPTVNTAFDGIVSVLDDLPKFSSKSAVRITVTPSFASRWLVPRLRSWRALSEGKIDVHLIPTLRVLDLLRDEADVAIRCGIAPWPGLISREVVPIHMVPVCSPQTAHGGKVNRPEDLLNFTLLHADVGQNLIGTEWQTWFEAAGVPCQKRLAGLSFKDPSLAWQAAINGLGFAIGYEELIQPDLASHALVKKFEVTVRHSFSYHLVYTKERKSDPALNAFLDWVTTQAARPAQ
jgi:LysR family transcriptional regulator, glycine cleavage system transcriptional activator